MPRKSKIQIAQEQLKAYRMLAGLSVDDAARLVDVTPITWSRWEGSTQRRATIPPLAYKMFLLEVNMHPEYEMVPREKTNDS